MLYPLEQSDVPEFFISERFIQSQEWNPVSSEKSCPCVIKKYTYTKDYVKRNGFKYYTDITNEFRFSEIIHATHQHALLSIIKDSGFKPGTKIIPGCGITSFVWFAMKIGLLEVNRFKYFSTSDKSAKIDCSSIANSPCFEPMSRYGEFKLTFEIQNVINAYSQQFCPWTKPDLRILGTFIYKMEIMHTVLVCPPGTPGTSKYPLLDQKQTPVICEDPEKEGTFIWRPDSTGDKDNADIDPKKRKPFRRWEHVTFAFYVPAGSIFKLDHVSSHISVCIYLNPKERYKTYFIDDTIQMFLAKVSEESSIETRRWLVNILIRSIRGYLDEEKVFENMNISYMYQLVGLDTVVDRVEQLLEGKEFDWSPLFEWIKAKQPTKNKAVIVCILKYLKNQEEKCHRRLRIQDV
ncbi:hypothetical protein ACJMK2_030655 [Sinanodonta woodiana]|uniref:Uncharacterized protein n=1 Tax=Sinanodonta woodiana TaxID=1069815 RepID=A0ABD3X0C5_SINWO